MKVLKRIGTVVISVLLWVIILVAALYAFTTMASRDNQNVANILGYTPLAVQSDSMSPTFDSGDLIFIRTCDLFYHGWFHKRKEVKIHLSVRIIQCYFFDIF